MTNVLTALFSTYTIQVLVDANSDQTGFRLSGPGLLGESYVTSPGLTARILASPEFDQLSGAERAQRILAMVLEQATR